MRSPPPPTEDFRLRKWMEMMTQDLPHGTVTLVAGVATVNDVRVTENANIQLTSQVDGGTPGWLRVSSRVVKSSFTITSSSATDTSTIGWVMLGVFY